MSGDKFTPSELEAHRQAAARGELPTLEVLAKFVRTIRRSWLALPQKTQDKAKSRVKKPKISEEQIDFF